MDKTDIGHLMEKDDTTQTHALVVSMNPVNIIKENSAIPVFIFKYFKQKNMSNLIDRTWEVRPVWILEIWKIGVRVILLENASGFSWSKRKKHL